MPTAKHKYVLMMVGVQPKAIKRDFKGAPALMCLCVGHIRDDENAFAF